ncbi:MAG TPA: class I SAM-dependent methyltransferase [Candidatus Hydrogenedens sp.]|nr:class I SAM-dependent methyltransferase [Candidatus Hydrogenedens sp.]HOK08259.1 class I SAM-dependent methyltransferase [Candidatus Hydrogenedens sp.]HOL20730.1 class I SAM-dependent methyltransferase [Candidatus Hydrogenedens sp.]HPP59150.1 class I SAM-dependent methyltransferase [Candidatus Hydrogenedens sp.]
MDKKQNTDWYIQAFDKWYPIVYQQRNEQEAKEQVNFVLSELDLSPHHKVLDLCCGYGRHIQYIKEKIPTTIGIDISTYLLRKAQESLKNTVIIVRGDIRCLPFKHNTFDAVLSFFTSFGYFANEKDNIKQIKNVYNVLKGNGLFFLDYLNPEQAINIKMNRTKRIINNYTVIETRWYDDKTKILKKKVEIFSDENTIMTTYVEHVRIYMCSELETMLKQNNFAIMKTFGDYKKNKYTELSPRLIIVSKKNE